MKKFSVAAHLSHSDYVLLLTVYANHNSSMGLEERMNYGIGNITEVKRNYEQNCLEVYYDNGDWWKYHTDGSWS